MYDDYPDTGGGNEGGALLWTLVTAAVVAMLGGFLLAACTDADRSGLAAYGTPAHVTCYSNGVKIYEGDSTGAVATDSDGNLGFEDAITRRYVNINESQCVIRH